MTKTPYFGPAAPRLGPPHIWRANGPMMLLIGLLLFAACRKDDPDPPPPPPPVAEKPDTLPPMTTIGANTFGCYLNGKLWLPKADWKAYFDPSFNTIQAAINENGGGYMNFKSSIEGSVKLFSFGIKAKQGIYYARSGDGVAQKDEFSVYYFDFDTNTRYFPDDRGRKTTNFLEVTYIDSVNRILSGHYQFTLHKGSQGKIINYSDSLTITKGRFDIRYR